MFFKLYSELELKKSLQRHSFVHLKMLVMSSQNWIGHQLKILSFLGFPILDYVHKQGKFRNANKKASLVRMSFLFFMIGLITSNGIFSIYFNKVRTIVTSSFVVLFTLEYPTACILMSPVFLHQDNFVYLLNIMMEFERRQFGKRGNLAVIDKLRYLIIIGTLLKNMLNYLPLYTYINRFTNIRSIVHKAMDNWNTLLSHISDARFRFISICISCFEWNWNRTATIRWLVVPFRKMCITCPKCVSLPSLLDTILDGNHSLCRVFSCHGTSFL